MFDKIKKHFKGINKKLNKKAFTLIEIIIAIALAATATTAAGSIIVHTNNNSNQMLSESELQQHLSEVQSMVHDQILDTNAGFKFWVKNDKGGSFSERESDHGRGSEKIVGFYNLKFNPVVLEKTYYVYDDDASTVFKMKVIDKNVTSGDYEVDDDIEDTLEKLKEGGVEATVVSTNMSKFSFDFSKCEDSGLITFEIGCENDDEVKYETSDTVRMRNDIPINFDYLEIPDNHLTTIEKPNVPDVPLEYTYNNQIYSPHDRFWKSEYTRHVEVVDGSTKSEKDVGDYTIIYRLKDPETSEWQDGTKDPIIIRWKINPKPIQVKWNWMQWAYDPDVKELGRKPSAEPVINTGAKGDPDDQMVCPNDICKIEYAGPGKDGIGPDVTDSTVYARVTSINKNGLKNYYVKWNVYEDDGVQHNKYGDYQVVNKNATVVDPETEVDGQPSVIQGVANMSIHPIPASVEKIYYVPNLVYKEEIIDSNANMDDYDDYNKNYKGIKQDIIEYRFSPKVPGVDIFFYVKDYQYADNKPSEPQKPSIGEVNQLYSQTQRINHGYYKVWYKLVSHNKNYLDVGVTTVEGFGYIDRLANAKVEVVKGKSTAYDGYYPHAFMYTGSLTKGCDGEHVIWNTNSDSRFQTNVRERGPKPNNMPSWYKNMLERDAQRFNSWAPKRYPKWYTTKASVDGNHAWNQTWYNKFKQQEDNQVANYTFENWEGNGKKNEIPLAWMIYPKFVRPKTDGVGYAIQPLTYNGRDQALHVRVNLEPNSPFEKVIYRVKYESFDSEFASDNRNWSESDKTPSNGWPSSAYNIKTGYNAGNYYVQFKCIGKNNYEDSDWTDVTKDIYGNSLSGNKIVINYNPGSTYQDVYKEKYPKYNGSQHTGIKGTNVVVNGSDYPSYTNSATESNWATERSATLKPMKNYCWQGTTSDRTQKTVSWKILQADGWVTPSSELSYHGKGNPASANEKLFSKPKGHDNDQVKYSVDGLEVSYDSAATLDETGSKTIKYWCAATSNYTKSPEYKITCYAQLKANRYWVGDPIWFYGAAGTQQMAALVNDLYGGHYGNGYYYNQSDIGGEGETIEAICGLHSGNIQGLEHGYDAWKHVDWGSGWCVWNSGGDIMHYTGWKSFPTDEVGPKSKGRIPWLPGQPGNNNYLASNAIYNSKEKKANRFGTALPGMKHGNERWDYGG